MTEQQEAEVLLQVPRASIDEIIQQPGAPPSVGARRTVVSNVELLVLSLVFTQEQLTEAAAQLGVPQDKVAANPGEPVVVLLCGEYRVPMLRTVPCRKGSSLHYVFYVPNLPIGVNLDPTTPPEVLEAFDFIVSTYGHVEAGGIPALGASVPADAAHPAGPHTLAPGGQSMPLPSSAYKAASDADMERSGQAVVPEPAGGGYGMYSSHLPRPHDAGPVGPAPAYSHVSFEEQQRAAAADARSATEYVVPRRPPAAGTLIMQTAPDIPPMRTSTRIAHGIGEFARVATNLITGGSDMGARGIRMGAQHVVANTAACENPVHVPEAARGHIRRSRYCTKGAVMVSGAFASAMVGVTSVVSDQISSRLRSHVPKPSEERSTLDDVKEVGIAAVGAAAAVTDAAMDAARNLLTATTDGTSQIVTHKFGAEAGEITQDGLGLATDTFSAAGNMRKAGLKSIAKATLKDTVNKTVS